MNPVDIPKTSIIFAFELFNKIICHLGYESASATFQRRVDKIFSDVNGWLVVLFYGVSTFFESFNAELSYFEVSKNSVQYKYIIFIYTQLNVKTVIFQTIQLSIRTQFKRTVKSKIS